MGKQLADAFPSARAVFDEVDQALGQYLSRLMFEGPSDELTLTANAQPALMAVSLAVVSVLREEAGVDLGRDAAFVAGHSLGEYSALAAARAIPLAATAKLLRLRGDAMQKAVKAGDGAMIAIIGVEPDVAAMIAAQVSRPDSVCQVANDNGGGQVVLSGAASAIERVAEVAKQHGVKRAIPLPVSAPFHCTLMQPAAEAMAAALADTKITKPAVPVVANVTAAPVQDPAEIRDLLVRQITATVRWRESVAFMSRRASLFVECGAGKVLSGLVRRIAVAATGISIGTPADIDAFRTRSAA